jgi:hypothetical protein
VNEPRLPGVPSTGLFGTCGDKLCCLQHELNFHRLKRKDNTASFNTFKYTRIQQGGHIAVHGFDVTFNTPRGFADGDRACTAQSFE